MNKAYLDLTGMRREDFWANSHQWSSTVIPEDREYVEEQWQRLVQRQSIQPFEFRVNREWSSPVSTDEKDRMEYSWILANAFLKYDEDGEPQRILAWLTDISHQKWSQQLQAQRLEDALETKRQSENFIDMTSHEMRNPLSAILQSADGILTALKFDKSESRRPSQLREPLFLDSEAQEIIIDSAQTVVLCAQHQKRIVDDILTLSKLDSNLLVICPDLVQPVTLIERAIKMYEAELNSANIKLNISIHQSYDNMDIDRVLLGPSRLLQVLINLLTNAIKFTKDRDKRAISIFLSASQKKPSAGHNNLLYIPRRLSRPDHTFSQEWGPGEDIFLQITVEDTGKGLTEDEMKLLFHRFSQASPKTYGEYGGSGLGLFISRELTELQGGEIGVASQAGHGSTFAFYIKARRPTLESADNKPSSPMETLRTPPLRRLSSHKRDQSDSTRRGDFMPLTSPSDPSWTYSRVETKNVSPAQPVEADPKARYPDLKILIVEVCKHVCSLNHAICSDLVTQCNFLQDNLINQKVLAQQLRRAGCTTHIANHGLEALSVLARSTFYTSDHENFRVKTPSQVLNNSTPPDQTSYIPDPDATNPIAPLSRSPSLPPTPPSSANNDSSSNLFDISVCLMDLEMPVMDGLSCIRRIRAMEAEGLLNRHVPVIAVTANARSEQIAIAMEAGMDLVITKPFRIPELLPQMEALVGRMGRQQG